MSYLTKIYLEDEQIFYAFTETREEGLLKALAYIAEYDSSPWLKERFVINQGKYI